MKSILVCFVLSACVHQSGKTEFHCDSISGAQAPFIEHTGTKKFENYVALNLDCADFAPMFHDLDKKFGPLKNRGEAHVTVITPPEFDQGLAAHLSISEINQIAKESGLQSSKLEPICIGRGQASIAGQTQTVYFIVLNSPDLIAFRRLVLKAFIAHGGDPAQFKAENFYPHITLGFSLRDLHESDGVKKDQNTCLLSLK